MARGQRVAAEWGGGPARLGPNQSSQLGPNQSSQLAPFPSTSNDSISYISDYQYIIYIYLLCTYISDLHLMTMSVITSRCCRWNMIECNYTYSETARLKSLDLKLFKMRVAF